MYTFLDILSDYLLHSVFADFDSEEEESEFFYPNACQICGHLRRLLRCSRCQMVSYCGKEHQSIHWPSHKTFCKVLAETRKGCQILQDAKNRKPETWTNARIAFINKVSIKLSRKLTPYEEKVIKFTRACVVCHDVTQNNLINCQNCASVSFCQQHIGLFDQVHADKCHEFKLCYILDLEKHQEKNKPQEEPQPKKRRSEPKKNSEFRYPRYCEREKKFKAEKKWEREKRKNSDESENSKEVDEYLDQDTKITVIKRAPIKSVPYLEKRPDSMRSFLESFPPRELNYKKSQAVNFEIPDLFIKPLSTYQALEKLDLVKERDLVIHVIGAKVEDLDTYLFWETLLHWMPTLTSLKIVLICKEFARQIKTPKICDKCAEAGKELFFELYNLRYENFIEETNFSTPNLVIGFKIQTKEEADSLLIVANLNVPFAFTNDEEKFAKNNHKYMSKLFKRLVVCDVFEENPFSGVKPRLNFETNGITYEHHYLTIYTHLRKRVKDNKKM